MSSSRWAWAVAEVAAGAQVAAYLDGAASLVAGGGGGDSTGSLARRARAVGAELGVAEPDAVAIYASLVPVSFSGGIRVPLLDIDSRFVALAEIKLLADGARPGDALPSFATAHEMAHLAEHHPLVLTAVHSFSAGAAAAGIVSAWAGGGRPLSARVAATAAAIGLVVVADTLASQLCELRADARAAGAGYAAAGIAALESYGEQFGVHPLAWSRRHPPLALRLALLRKYGV
ncbi:uncharacterized protein AMSG_07767 [Thecamonas trahens ATCC 50062]|uniref:Peptidase M48 domain-containing protein n=1 Tax=Thecamonas trahens ATCC 50062 TaxID=461836 RepID=A0A0L0DHB3_THETB|nr:hypothetical protein AMSG_07767 [Thecamonas trahens ATCC 50062]KNC51702.1 hypothetical protein AMSG_07767 [Thecamonas trahens ATCC 50062]|eukprot:XP_013755831.1 hypothetical protein AMSG_07767 [Thecamonas trahens ATCC 50062]